MEGVVRRVGETKSSHASRSAGFKVASKSMQSLKNRSILSRIGVHKGCRWFVMKVLVGSQAQETRLGRERQAVWEKAT